MQSSNPLPWRYNLNPLRTCQACRCPAGRLQQRTQCTKMGWHGAQNQETNNTGGQTRGFKTHPPRASCTCTLPQAPVPSQHNLGCGSVHRHAGTPQACGSPHLQRASQALAEGKEQPSRVAPHCLSSTASLRLIQAVVEGSSPTAPAWTYLLPHTYSPQREASPVASYGCAPMGGNDQGRPSSPWQQWLRHQPGCSAQQRFHHCCCRRWDRRCWC